MGIKVQPDNLEPNPGRALIMMRWKGKKPDAAWLAHLRKIGRKSARLSKMRARAKRRAEKLAKKTAK